jgi:phytoene synthase
VSVAVLARCGRSFRLAGRLLPGDTLRDAAALYAFCRAVDDLADESDDPTAARAELLALRSAVIAGHGTHGPARPFLALQASRGVDPRSAATLIDTVLRDIGAVRLADEAALLDYAYGAAGTVGEMMCAVLGVRTSQARPHAVDLGMAMQLTNIARDVIEDAARGRVYLPAAWLPAEVTAATMASCPQAVFPAVRRVLERADRGYRSGERGYAHLPPRMRPAIRAASRLYEEIGLRILHLGPAYLTAGRCVVPTHRRLALVASCLLGTERFARHAAGRLAAAPLLPGARA